LGHGTGTQILADKVERAAEVHWFGRLVGRIPQVLLDDDRIGLNFTNQADEYRTEAETITLRLSGAPSRANLLAIVHEEFVASFTESTAGSVRRYDGIASEVWALLQQPRRLADRG
jgi:hypothetical protein